MCVGPGNTAHVLAAAALVFTMQPVNHVSVFFFAASRSMDEQYSSDADSESDGHHGGLPGPSDPKKSKTGVGWATR